MKKISLILLLLLSFPFNAYAVNDESFTFYPKTANSINPLLCIYEAAPGTTINDTLILHNKASVAQAFEVYATEGFQNEKGALEYLDVRVEKQYATWMTVSMNNIVLEPGQQTEVNFQIDIPEDAQHSLYMLGIAATREKQAKDENQVKIVSRMVTPVKLTVTDNPQYIPTQEELLAQQEEERIQAAREANALALTPFSYGTMAVFLVCMGYLAFSFIKDRKKKKLAKKK